MTDWQAATEEWAEILRTRDRLARLHTDVSLLLVLTVVLRRLVTDRPPSHDDAGTLAVFLASCASVVVTIMCVYWGSYLVPRHKRRYLTGLDNEEIS